MPKALINRFPQLGSTTCTKYIYGYVFLSKSDSKKYCKNTQFREYISSQIDTKKQLLLTQCILEEMQDLHILKTIYGVYYNACLYMSNIERLRYFDSNQSQKILDFNLYCVKYPSDCVEIYNYLSYLHLILYDIGSGTYAILTIGYEHTIV